MNRALSSFRRHPVAAGVASLSLGVALATWAAADFSVDSAFGPNGNGLATYEALGGTADFSHSADFAKTSGNIYVFAEQSGNPPAPYKLVRYTSAGIADNSFGNNGVLTLATSAGYDSFTTVAVDEGHQLIYLVGTIHVSGSASGSKDVAVQRFDFQGALDSGFGTGGTFLFSTPAAAPRAHRARLKDDGTRMAILGGDGTGNAESGLTTSALVAVLDTGAPATSGGLPGLVAGFGTKGVFEAALTATAACDEFDDLQVDRAGNFDLAAVSFTGDTKDGCLGIGDRSPSIGVARLTPAGALDPSFDSNGAVQGVYLASSTGTSLEGVATLRVDANGEIAFAYRAASTTGSANYALSLLQADGSALDGSFGVNGTLSGLVSLPTGFSLEGGVALQDDGKVLLPGAESQSGVNGGYPQVTVLRVNGDPALATGPGSSSSGGSSGASSSGASSSGGSSSGGLSSSSGASSSGSSSSGSSSSGGGSSSSGGSSSGGSSSGASSSGASSSGASSSGGSSSGSSSSGSGSPSSSSSSSGGGSSSSGGSSPGASSSGSFSSGGGSSSSSSSSGSSGATTNGDPPASSGGGGGGGSANLAVLLGLGLAAAARRRRRS